jgi:hypothetical protein
MEKVLVGLVSDMVRLSWSLGALMVGYCSGVGQRIIGGGPRLLIIFRDCYWIEGIGGEGKVYCGLWPNKS